MKFVQLWISNRQNQDFLFFHLLVYNFKCTMAFSAVMMIRGLFRILVSFLPHCWILFKKVRQCSIIYCFFSTVKLEQLWQQTCLIFHCEVFFFVFDKINSNFVNESFFAGLLVGVNVVKWAFVKSDEFTRIQDNQTQKKSDFQEIVLFFCTLKS